MSEPESNPNEGLREVQIGVSEYVNKDLVPFTAIIKARFSDFHVNEIDVDGNLIEFTDRKLPILESTDEAASAPENLELEMMDENMIKIQKMLEDENKETSVEIDVTTLGKIERTELHKKIKSLFGQKVNSTTEQRDLQKIIKCSRYSKKGPERRAKWPWPHEYTYFVMYKENADTIKACLDLSTNMRIHPSAISYAGTKDKRGKTSQLCCVKFKDPQAIARAASRLQNISVGNFSFKSEVLKLGMLTGNRFRIVLRQVTADVNQIETSLKSLQANGFLNYYGLQRFGNCREIPTYEIGKRLLASNFKEACDLIMKPRAGEKPYLEKMRTVWWKTQDAAAALKNVYKSNRSVEAKLLEGFVRHGKNDYVGALNSIPRNMRLLYLHAYQSLIFNKIVSRRVKEFGMELLVGDLVFADASVEILNTEKSDSLIDGDEDTPMDEQVTDEEKTEQSEVSTFKSMVRPLTKEDISSNKYSISDIVYPLPGHDITYPNNVIADWYREYLAEDELSSDKLKQKLKIYSLTGAYRKWLVKPNNMSWQFKKYNSSTDNIILSDLEKLQRVPEPLDMPDGKFKALIVDFCLPASVYATMALRELLRQETSPYNQTQLEKTLLVEASKRAKVVKLGEKRESTADSENENFIKKTKMEEK